MKPCARAQILVSRGKGTVWVKVLFLDLFFDQKF